MTNKNEETEDENQINVEQEEKQEITNMRLGISNIDTLNPILSKNQNLQDMLKLVYEPLFSISEDFKLENALGIEYSKADSKSYLIRLRENVKWHDGSEFTAEDINFTINKIKELGDDSIYNANVSNIEKVEIISNYLIKLYLYEEKPFFEYNLVFPIISANLFKEEDIRVSDKNNTLIGTGKYKLKPWENNLELELEKNQSWWNAENKELRIDTITIRKYDEIAEVYNAYKLGGVDMIVSRKPNNRRHNRNDWFKLKGNPRKKLWLFSNKYKKQFIIR